MNRLAFNSLVLVIANFSNAALGFVLAVMIGRVLGVEDLGRYTLALSWALGLSMLADLGLSTLLTREVARQAEETSRYLTAAVLIKTVISFALMFFLYVAAPILSADAASATAMRIAAPFLYLNALYTSFTAIFRAFQRMTPILVLNTGGLVIQIGAAWWLLANGRRALELTALAVAIQLIQVIAAYVIYRAHYRPHLPRRALDASFFKTIGRAAFPFAVAGLLGAAQLRANVLLLGSLLDARAVGLFGAASRWTEATKMIPSGFFGALFPALSAQTNQPEALERTFQRAERVVLLFGVAAALLLTLAASPLLGFTFGEAFAPAAPVLQTLGWALLPWLWNGVMGLYLYALGDEHFVNWISAAGLVVLLGAGTVCMAQWGATGAAIAALASECCMTILYHRRCEILRRRRMTWNTLGSMQ
ncbi:MAG: flippase [Chloroflexi bacterium]|nr:flippase [Chloroflexota bacterium]